MIEKFSIIWVPYGLFNQTNIGGHLDCAYLFGYHTSK